MSNRSSCNPSRPLRTSERVAWLVCLGAACALWWSQPARAEDQAPQWMHALVGAPLPAHDEKTEAVLLYSEKSINVLSADKIKKVVRVAYKILRPEGRDYGSVGITFNSQKRITSLHGWCIPAQGKDFVVRDKDGIEVSLPKIEGSELVSDVKEKLLRIPAPEVGNIVGFEYEAEEQPLVLQDTWDFQEEIPARERHYSLQLPSGWEYKASWLNYPEVKPLQVGNQWQWTITDVKPLKKEDEMPPLEGLSSQLVLNFIPPSSAPGKWFTTWQDMGVWYRNLTAGRLDASNDIKQRVSLLTASATTPLQKMKLLAQFIQHDVRYVAIELGIGGWQPHSAADVMVHHYGDCKDKATLLASMLHEIGVDSYYIVINTERGSVGPNTPAQPWGFNHVILAIRLPDAVSDSSLIATMNHPRLGKILIFDPTSEITPFGQLRGHLQANYGLLVTPDGGELIELPKLPSTMNGVQRTGKLTVDPTGTLRGDIHEVRLGDYGFEQRWALRSVSKDTDKIKPIERLLADSLPTFHITAASAINLQRPEEPFGFTYSFDAENYAKNAGGLMLLRPRVLGRKSSALLETKEPRRFPIEFEDLARDTDSFEITLPPGYEVDDLPPPVDADYSFGSYHSKTEAVGNVLRYSRTFELKELSVPVSQADELKKFYRIIAGDERNTAVLRPSAAK